MLTDGGIETRVMFETDVELPEHVQVAALVGDPAGGAVLRGIYGGYIEAARAGGLPVPIGTPTFRASLNFVHKAGSAAKRRSADSTAKPRRCAARSGQTRTTGRCTSPG